MRFNAARYRPAAIQRGPVVVGNAEQIRAFLAKHKGTLPAPSTASEMKAWRPDDLAVHYAAALARQRRQAEAFVQFLVDQQERTARQVRALQEEREQTARLVQAVASQQRRATEFAVYLSRQWR